MGTIITFDFQAWAKTKKIYVLAGVEVLGYKDVRDDLYVKTSRCDQCGKCCETVHLADWNNPPISVLPAGYCVFRILEPGTNDKYRCLLGTDRPFSCCVEEPRDAQGAIQSYCSVAYAIESRCSDKIMVIELPDWAEERNIHFCLADEIGTFAYKHPGENLFIKVDRCDQCGECCKGINQTQEWNKLGSYMQVVDNVCSKLTKSGNKWICSYGINSRYTCVVGIPRDVNGNIETFCNQSFMEQI